MMVKLQDTRYMLLSSYQQIKTPDNLCMRPIQHKQSSASIVNGCKTSLVKPLPYTSQIQSQILISDVIIKQCISHPSLLLNLQFYAFVITTIAYI